MKTITITAKEYSEIMGYSDKAGNVNKMIRSGNFPPEWIGLPRKSGKIWLVTVRKEWYENKY